MNIRPGLIRTSLVAAALAAGIAAIAAGARAQTPAAGSGAATGDGATIFTAAGCAGCHGADGSGGVGPALAGNGALADDAHIITQILNGGAPMPAFADRLGDADIAAVATYIRASWGNAYPPIDAAAVTAARNAGPAASTGTAGATAPVPPASVAVAASGVGEALNTRANTADQLLHVPVSGIVPGAATGLPDVQPPSNDPDAASRGQRYFDAFNCSGCHAANGGGGMGPSLSNASFIYGSSAANIYLSIFQGRPGGMPAWGAMLPDSAIWDLVAYVKNLSAAPDTGWGQTISRDPPSPAIEQVPADKVSSVTPWQNTQPINAGHQPGTE